MSFFSAMMASVSGMQGQATLLSTISDNISNSSTTGYKEATASFEDMLSQVSTTSYTAGGVGTTIGYGISTQGDLQAAARPPIWRSAATDFSSFRTRAAIPI